LGSIGLLFSAAALFLRVGLLPSIKASSDALKNITEGDFKSDIDIKRGDELGDIWVRIIVNPVFDTQGGRIGTVTEWLDRTQEVALEHMVEHEVKGLVEAAKRVSYRVVLR